jgi:phage gpG-like protein
MGRGSNIVGISGFGQAGYTVRGLDHLTRDLRMLAVANKRPERTLKLIGARMKRICQDHFQSQKNLDGSPWPPLSEITISLRRKRSNVPLRDTGRLKNSIGIAVKGASVSVGTNVAYAETHQFGHEGTYTKEPDKKKGRKWSKTLSAAAREAIKKNVEAQDRSIPAREFIYMNDADITDLITMLKNQLIKDLLT